MSAARDPDQADFDLERFIDMFDEAVSSKDPRVVNALRSLMMIVTLTRPESRDSGLHDRNSGPLRRLYEDVNHLNRRMYDIEDTIRRVSAPPEQKAYHWEEKDKYTMIAAQQQVAAKMDQDTINKMKAKARGLYHK